MLYPFPTDLPFEGIALLIDKLRGKDVPLKTAVNAAWNLAGYAAGQMTPEDHKLIIATESNEAETIEMLETLLASKEDSDRVMMIPWVIIFRVAIKILLSLV